MVYKKKNFRKKKQKPGMFSAQRAPTTLASIGNMASSAFRIASGVATLLNVEYKYRDVLQSAITPSSTTDNIFLVNGIAQGQDNSERIGRSIKGMYLTYKGTASWNSAATSNVITIKVVLDTKTQGTVPAALDMFTIRTELGHRNIDYTNRFKVLDQKCFVLSSDDPFKCFESFLDLKHKPYAHTKYDGIGATNADISSHPIYIVVMSSNTVNLASVNINHRFRFVDN